MNTKSEYPKLRNLLGGYFHQDWVQSFDWQGNEPNYAEVVRFFKMMSPTETVAQAAKELRFFLGLELSENRIKDKLWMVYFIPQTIGLTYSQWLKEVLNILEDRTQNKTYLKEIEQEPWTGWEEYAHGDKT